MYENGDKKWRETARKGAYVVKDCSGTPDITVLATGSEVSLALDAAKLASGKKVRVVSVLDKTLFDSQDSSFRDSILGGAKRIVVAEAGVRMGWEGYAEKEDCFTLNDFGESGPAAKVAEHLGFTAAALADVLNR